MNKIKVICDTLADVTKDMVSKYDIEVVPLTIIIEGTEYKANIDMTTEEFYKKVKTMENTPKTSQVTYFQFKEVFEKYIKEEYDILYIAGSSKTTGTINSALMAKADIDTDCKIEIVDSLNLSFGCGCQVIKACELRDEGKDLDEIVKTIKDMQEDITLLFEVEDLDYLLKGGRITKSKAFVGNALNIKPILHMEDGEIKELMKVRGKKHVVSKIIETIRKKYDNDLSNKKVTVANGDNYQDMIILKQAIEKEFDVNVAEVEIGASIGSHTGPGTIGVCINQK